MKSYFFIPSNKSDFLVKANEIDADHIVLDLEDAIFNTSLDEAVSNILSDDLSREYFVRVAYPIDNPAYLHRLTSAGYRKFFLPKAKTADEVDKFIAYLLSEGLAPNDLEIFVLVENAQALHNLGDILSIGLVKGVNIGSHDYCDSVGMEHNLKNLYWARMEVLNAAKAFGKIAIDIASVNLNDEHEFVAECKDGLGKGFDGKFIIHPWQLNLFNQLARYSNEEIAFARKVKEHIDKLGGISNFSIANIEGKIVEKPHLKRINQILKSSGNDTF